MLRNGKILSPFSLKSQRACFVQVLAALQNNWIGTWRQAAAGKVLPFFLQLLNSKFLNCFKWKCLVSSRGGWLKTIEKIELSSIVFFPRFIVIHSTWLERVGRDRALNDHHLITYFVCGTCFTLTRNERHTAAAAAPSILLLIINNRNWVNRNSKLFSHKCLLEVVESPRKGSISLF